MLLDTHEFMYQGYEHILREHGYPPIDRMLIDSYIGRSQAECYEAFAPGCDPQALIAADDRYRPKILHLIQGYEGLHEMLGALKSAGFKLGIVSGRTVSLIPSLKNTGIADYFDVIVRGDEVAQGKPHPEGIEKALKQLSIEPQSSAMLGDAVVDIQAGQAANLALTVGITHGFGRRKDLEQARPNHLIDSLSEIPPLLIRENV
ncbi:MAG: ppaX [Patescibacteria group bacterium]|nr:ppaX [Patescibacteria group bacterium]